MASAKEKSAKNEADQAKAAEAQTSESKAKTEDKPKRRQLSPAERVAKLEAELAAAKEKANARGLKKLEQARSRKAALVEKRDGLNDLIKEVDEQIAELEGQVNDGADDESETEDQNAA